MSQGIKSTCISISNLHNGKYNDNVDLIGLLWR